MSLLLIAYNMTGMKTAVKKVIGSYGVLRFLFVKFQNVRRRFFDKRALELSAIAKTQGHENVFDYIYKKKFWQNAESVSGWGSTLEITKELRPRLEKLLGDLNVKSFLDVPCGDFNWMKEVNFGETKYIGGDIVRDLVTELNQRYESDKRSFIHLDVATGKLPDVEMIFIRDCFIHLNNTLVENALRNIASSSIKYFVTTHAPGIPFNAEIETGQFRDINFTKAPFNLPEPMLVINEGCIDPLLKDKSLGVWKVSELMKR